MSIRLAFFGTPEIAVPVLDALHQAGYEIAAVVTAPDRPKGRGMQLAMSAVKQRASELGLRVLQPTTLKSDQVHEQLEHLAADVFVVAAYGLLLPSRVLDITAHGCINVHFSVLPKLRGAAPVQWAIIEGFDRTGVSIMKMDAGLDTGPVLAVATEPIASNDTAGTLAERLSVLGARLCADVLPRVLDGRTTPRLQDDTQSTYAPKLSAADAHIDWTASSVSIDRRVRAFDPRPGAWCILNNKRVKVWKVEKTDRASGRGPGTVVIDGDAMFATTADGELGLVEVQPEGRARMSGSEFVRGYRPITGDQLG